MTGLIPTVEQIDDLHRKLAPSQAAYDLIHTHCTIVATITRMLIGRQNDLLMRKCTLPQGETVRPTQGVTGGVTPPYYLDARIPVLGALVHDIGTYRVLKNDGSDGEPLQFDGDKYIQHGILGYELLLEEGYDESIAQFARNHTGVGLTYEEVRRQHLPLPPDDYVPMDLGQEVVMVADKYHSKSVPPKFLTAGAYERKAARFGEDNAAQWRELVHKYGEPDVHALAEEYGMRVKE